MHQHTINYTDFNGNAKTKTLHFNLTEAELVKIQKDSPRGIQVEMQEAIDSGDSAVLLDFLEMLVHKSYGIKSDDGEEFEKTPELTRKFENSAYYSDLYMSLFQNEGKTGADFISKIMPAHLIDSANKKIRDEQIEAARNEGSANLAPDARELFAQRQSEISAGGVSQENNPNPLVASEPYVPQNQPSYPSVQDAQPVQNAPTPEQSFRQADIPAQPDPTADPNPAVMTRADWAAQQEREAAEQARLPRPPHEAAQQYPPQQ